MYTNIDTMYAHQVIDKWLKNNVCLLFPNFLLKAVVEAMHLAMTHIVFELRGLFFLQLLGIAMGTSSAYM